MALGKTPSIQECFEQGLFPAQQRWITEELRRDLSAVTDFSLEAEVIEDTPDVRGKSYRRGEHDTCHVTFTDGADYAKVGKRGVNW